MSKSRVEVKNERVNGLVQKVKCNDTSAFLELLGLFSPTISSIAYSFSLPKSEYEDLCQEGRMALYRAAKSFDEMSAQFSTYAVACITNAMINFSKKYRTGAISQSVSEKEMAEEVSAEAQFLAEDLYDMLTKTENSTLSEYEKKVVSLALSGLKTREISARLGKSAKSVDNTLFRARSKIKIMLGK